MKWLINGESKIALFATLNIQIETAQDYHFKIVL
jgi:hypothetical protein